jgi:hypothetical protein
MEIIKFSEQLNRAFISRFNYVDKIKGKRALLIKWKSLYPEMFIKN